MTQEFLLQNSWLIALVVGSGGMLIYPVFFDSLAKQLTIAEAMLLINHKKAVLIDVRDQATVDEVGALGGATQVPYPELENKLPNMSKLKNKPLVFVCQNGHKSISASKIAKKLGFTDVYVLKGGFKSWLEAGMPLNKTSGSQKKMVDKQLEKKQNNQTKSKKRA